jgi:hypothetical protein
MTVKILPLLMEAELKRCANSAYADYYSPGKLLTKR